MPFDANSTLNVISSQYWLPRAVATIWRIVASLAVLAGIWSVVQVVQAIQAGGVHELLPSASIIYIAGLGYLALVAIIAVQFDRTIRANRAPKHSGLLLLAHLLVVVASVIVAWRGVSARGVLVGLGASLVSWGVVAILAFVAEIATLRAGKQLPNAADTTGTSAPSVGWLASACLGCVAVLGLGLAYLETRPLPNLPAKPHVSPAMEAGHVTSEKSATHDEPASSGDS